MTSSVENATKVNEVQIELPETKRNLLEEEEENSYEEDEEIWAEIEANSCMSKKKSGKEALATKKKMEEEKKSKQPGPKPPAPKIDRISWTSLFKYQSCSDKLLIVIGCIFSITSGALAPAISIAMG
jgi:hypothetical protein